MLFLLLPQKKIPTFIFLMKNTDIWILLWFVLGHFNKIKKEQNEDP